MVERARQPRGRLRADHLIEVAQLGVEVADDVEAEGQRRRQQRRRERREEERDRRDQHQLDEDEQDRDQQARIDAWRVPRRP